MATTIKAGFGRGVIRFPEALFPVEGFSGVHDDPHVRLMVLRYGDTAFALLEAELVIIPRRSIEVWRDMIANSFEIPARQVVVQMTHAITTPHEPGPLGPPDRRPEPTEEDLRKRALYHEATDKAVAEAIEQAKAGFGDATLGWGSGTCEVNVNCDVETSFGWWLGANPEGCSNHTMTVLRVNDAQENIRGVFVSYGMKPAAIDNAGRKENVRQVSSEVAGAFCKKMEEAYGVPVIYSVSAGGNQIPKQSALKHEVSVDGEAWEIDEGVAQGLTYAEAQGAEMCDACRKIVDAIACDEDIAAAAWADCAVTWTRRRGGPRKLVRELTHTPEGEAELTADLFRLGGTVFIMVRPEMTAECEKYLLDKSIAERTVLMTLTNGEMKCLPDQGSFDRGTYEAQGSNLMPGAAEALIDAVTEKIRTI